MYEKVSPNLNFVEREKAVLDFWKANKIFERSIETRRSEDYQQEEIAH